MTGLNEGRNTDNWMLPPKPSFDPSIVRVSYSLRYPEVLLEGQIKNLERRKRVFGGGGKNRVGKGDRDVDTFRQGDIGPIDLGLFD